MGVYGRGTPKFSNSVPPKRRAESDAKTNTFLAVADEWLLTKKASLTESTWARDRQQIHKWVVPYLGSKPIALIEAPDLLDVLERIEAKGVIDTAHRTREVCGRIFRYAIATAARGMTPLRTSLEPGATHHDPPRGDHRSSEGGGAAESHRRL